MADDFIYERQCVTCFFFGEDVRSGFFVNFHKFIPFYCACTLYSNTYAWKMLIYGIDNHIIIWRSNYWFYLWCIERSKIIANIVNGKLHQKNNLHWHCYTSASTVWTFIWKKKTASIHKLIRTQQCSRLHYMHFVHSKYFCDIIGHFVVIVLFRF